MTNQQPIKPVLPLFRAERNALINGQPEIFTGDSMELTGNGTLIIHTSKTRDWRYCKKETLQISLDGENFHSMEELSEALALLRVRNAMIEYDDKVAEADL